MHVKQVNTVSVVTLRALKILFYKLFSQMQDNDFYLFEKLYMEDFPWLEFFKQGNLT